MARLLLNQKRIDELGLGFSDTLIACSLQRDTVNYWHEMQWTRRYLAGEYPPHYPVPAIYLEIDQHRWTRFPQYLIDILRFRAYHYVSRLKTR